MNGFRVWVCTGAVSVGLSIGSVASAVSTDTFGTGSNQFTIDFVTIAGATNPASGPGIVEQDYRMGVYEITNAQWDRFKASLGVPVTGSPLSAYNGSPTFTAPNVPTNDVSWYEAAQFVNWLNTSTGHQPAYRFTGTQGTSDYTLATWSAAEADNGTNLYRHKDAFYYMPTEDEWIKAGYWNGTELQHYATKPGESLHQGDGVSGSGWNYQDNGYVFDPPGPWDVGSGSEELNGTFDMMGNVGEWTENPFFDSGYAPDSPRGGWGASFFDVGASLSLFGWAYFSPDLEHYMVGFRVAAEVPEPSSLGLLSLGGLAWLRKRRSGCLVCRGR